MPLFRIEENRLADSIGVSDLTIYLNRRAPTNADPANGRITTGGGAFESGATLAATDISAAANGDIRNTVAIPFGTAVASVGDVGWCSAFRGTAPVGFWVLDSVSIANNDTYAIAAFALNFNGSST